MGRVGWLSSRYDALVYECAPRQAHWLGWWSVKQCATTREILVISVTLSHPPTDDADTTAPGRYQRECVKKWQERMREDQEASDRFSEIFFTEKRLEPGRETYISLYGWPSGDSLTNPAYRQSCGLTLIARSVARKREEGWNVSLIRIAVRGYKRQHWSVSHSACTVKREAPGDYLSAAVARNALFMSQIRGEGVWHELLYECDDGENREN